MIKIFEDSVCDVKILDPGTQVWSKTDDSKQWDEQGVVVEHVQPQSYKVRLESGKLVFRNQRNVKKDERREDGSKKFSTNVQENEKDWEDVKCKGKERRSEKTRRKH